MLLRQCHSTSDSTRRDAAELALRDAVPLSQNGFKVELGKHSVLRALHKAITR